MNILTIPLVAVSAFSLYLAYTQLGSSRADQPAVKSVEQLTKALATHEHGQHQVIIQGKPAAALGLISEGVQTLPLLQDQTIDVVLQNQLKDGSIYIEVASSDGLEVLSSKREWYFDAAENPQIHLPVELIATQNGVHHLNVFIQYQTDQGENSARALAVEFKVGQDKDNSVKLYAKHENNETFAPVVSLKAKEDVY